jgi:cellulose synthase/poly-beta-1,6-N-acetylglucosamine synthase-like glycosyltransferase
VTETLATLLTVAQWALVALVIPPALVALYVALLTIAALTARRRTATTSPPTDVRFAVLVPAHDEERSIRRVLESLASVEYPRDHVDVHVVADNCTDATASVARGIGAAAPEGWLTVHERRDPERKAKGYALSWLLDRLNRGQTDYDAYVVLDADSVVSRNLFSAFAARLRGGSPVVQAYYGVLNASDSALAALRGAALAAIHLVRPLGRAALGLSCGLKGNGMCFAASVIERYGWTTLGLAEDVEFHLALVADGLRVDFAPEATVLAEMPVTFDQARSQNARWERGRVAALRGAGPRLLRRALQGRSWVPLDALIEQLIPPISVPIAAAGAVALASLVLGGWAWLIAGATLAAFALHLIAGLTLAGATWATYRGLAIAPLNVVWKAWLYAQALVAVLTNQGAVWVRTARR